MQRSEAPSGSLNRPINRSFRSPTPSFVWVHAFSKVGWKAPVRTEPLPTIRVRFIRLNERFRPSRHIPLRAQIRVLAIELVVFKGQIDVFIPLCITPSRSFIDNLILGTARSRRSKDRLDLFFRRFLEDFIVIGTIQLGDRATAVAPSQEQNSHHTDEA
jgi:hypothetical protein